MFTPIRKNAFRWGTPDPDAEWMMHGHLLVRDSGLILFDPPVVPGFIDALLRLGRPEAVIITTLDHIRAADYIAERTGATLYVPDQDPSQVDEVAVMRRKRFGDYEKYGTGRLFGMNVYNLKFEGDREKKIPSLSEFALLTGEKDLIVGDGAVGTADGKISVFPEWFSNVYKLPEHGPAHTAVSALIRETGAVSLFASHGFDIYGSLAEAAEEL